MPRRDDIPSIVLRGSGPPVTGQACEYECSGPQGGRAGALRPMDS